MSAGATIDGAFNGSSDDGLAVAKAAAESTASRLTKMLHQLSSDDPIARTNVANRFHAQKIDLRDYYVAKVGESAVEEELRARFADLIAFNETDSSTKSLRHLQGQVTALKTQVAALKAQAAVKRPDRVSIAVRKAHRLAKRHARLVPLLLKVTPKLMSGLLAVEEAEVIAARVYGKDWMAELSILLGLPKTYGEWRARGLASVPREVALALRVADQQRAK